MASAFLYTNCTITNSTLNIVGGGYNPQKGDVMIIIKYKETRSLY